MTDGGRDTLSASGGVRPLVCAYGDDPERGALPSRGTA